MTPGWDLAKPNQVLPLEYVKRVEETLHNVRHPSPNQRKAQLEGPKLRLPLKCLLCRVALLPRMLLDRSTPQATNLGSAGR